VAIKIPILPSTQWGNPVYGGGNEAQYCQDIAARLKPKLIAKGLQAEIFAGQQDANSDGARAAVAWVANQPAYAVSLHFDGTDGNHGSHQALVCYQEERSLPFCKALMNYYCEKLQFYNRGYMKRTPGVNGVAVIRIPESAGIPTCLLEQTWMDRNPDAQEIRDPAWREKFAQVEADAIGIALRIQPQPKEAEVGIAITDSGPTPVKGWVTTGLLGANRNAKVYLDIDNRGNAALNATIQIQVKTTGDFGSIKVSPAIPPSKAKQSSLYTCELGQLFNAANAGNIDIVVMGDQPFYAKVTQEMV
jgi:hypothetical protein